MTSDFSRFTSGARRVLAESQRIAYEAYGRTRITSGYLCESLLADPLVIEHVKQNKFDPDLLLERVRTLNSIGMNAGYREEGDISLSTRARNVIAKMVEIGKGENADLFTTVHMLKGMRAVDQIIEGVVFSDFERGIHREREG